MYILKLKYGIINNIHKMSSGIKNLYFQDLRVTNIRLVEYKQITLCWVVHKSPTS